MLDRATKDPHHRVAVNGLYGLYVAQVTGTAERMIQVAHSPSAQHRAAIAWAMGKTKSDEFTPELEKLADDGDDCVRSSATRALAQVRSAELATAAVG
jgi:HEAT repeat protein